MPRAFTYSVATAIDWACSEFAKTAIRAGSTPPDVVGIDVTVTWTTRETRIPAWVTRATKRLRWERIPMAATWIATSPSETFTGADVKGKSPAGSSSTCSIELAIGSSTAT